MIFTNLYGSMSHIPSQKTSKTWEGSSQYWTSNVLLDPSYSSRIPIARSTVQPIADADKTSEEVIQELNAID